MAGELVTADNIGTGLTLNEGTEKLEVDAATVEVTVEGLTATTLEAALLELLGLVGGGGGGGGGD